MGLHYHIDMIPGIRSTIAGLTLGKNKKLNLELGSIAAAGSSQSDATAASYVVNNVTASDGTKGVVFTSTPGTVASRLKIVYNSVASQALKVYPPSGGTINGGSSNAAVSVTGKTLAIFVSTDGSNWGAIYT